MTKAPVYIDIGEGMSLKNTKDREFTVRNNLTGKERTFVSSKGKLLIDDKAIDFESIRKIYDRDTVYDKSARYGFHRKANFKDGLCRLQWIIYPDGCYFADSDGYGMKDNDEESATCTINTNLEIIEPFRPDKKVKDIFSQSDSIVRIDEDVEDNESIDILIDDDGSTLESGNFMQNESQTNLNFKEYIKNLRRCRDQLDASINALGNQFDIKQFNANVFALKIGESNTLVNIKNGSSRVLIDKEGSILFNKTENPEGIFTSTLTLVEVESDISNFQMEVREASLECIHVSPTGYCIIRLIKYDYQKEKEMELFIYNSPYREYMPHLSPEEAFSLCRAQYYCILDNEFRVVIPIRELKNKKKSCDPNLFSNEEWENIWRIQ